MAADVEGFTEPFHDIDIAASEMGLLDGLEVKEGDRVTAGQLLARLDDAVLRAALAIAKTTMESEGRLESAQAEVELQAAMVAKLHELREQGHASQQEIKRAEVQLRVAEARLKTADEEQQIRKLEYERARVQIDQRHMISPIDGIVTRIYKDRGEFVSLSDPVILKVVQLDPLLVVFSVPAVRVRELTVGQTVNVRIAESKTPAQGEVDFVSPTVDPQSGTTRVRVRISNPEEKLPCGATCRLLLIDQTPARPASRAGRLP